MKRQRVENNKLTSHGRRCYRTVKSESEATVASGNFFFIVLLQVQQAYQCLKRVYGVAYKSEEQETNPYISKMQILCRTQASLSLH